MAHFNATVNRHCGTCFKNMLEDKKKFKKHLFQIKKLANQNDHNHQKKRWASFSPHTENGDTNSAHIEDMFFHHLLH